jgi:hypothetical protein
MSLFKDAFLCLSWHIFTSTILRNIPHSTEHLLQVQFLSVNLLYQSFRKCAHAVPSPRQRWKDLRILQLQNHHQSRRLRALVSDPTGLTMNPFFLLARTCKTSLETCYPWQAALHQYFFKLQYVDHSLPSSHYRFLCLLMSLSLQNYGEQKR